MANQPDSPSSRGWLQSIRDEIAGYWARHRRVRIAAISLLICTAFLAGKYVDLSIGLEAAWQKVVAFGAAASATILACLATLNAVLKLEIADRTVSALKAGLNDTSRAHSVAATAVANQAIELIAELDTRGIGRIEERETHWTKEKEFLGAALADFLGERVKYLLEKGKQIVLVLDSGSTISPLFSALARRTAHGELMWTKSRQVRIVTNNIAGALKLLKYRDRSAPDDRHAEIPFPCELLPGTVLSAYAATAGKETVAAIRALKEGGQSDDGADRYVIAVTTGNYIFYHDEGAFCSIARTGLHPAIKVALAEVADEVYYVAPLGKVLRAEGGETLGAMRDRFNQDLDFVDPSARRLEERPYNFAVPGHEDGRPLDGAPPVEEAADALAHKAILVTTTRPEKTFVLQQHGATLANHFREMKTNDDPVVKNGQRRPRKLMWEFGRSELPPSTEDQYLVEFPHTYLRDRAATYFRGVSRLQSSYPPVSSA